MRWRHQHAVNFKDCVAQQQQELEACFLCSWRPLPSQGLGGAPRRGVGGRHVRYRQLEVGAAGRGGAEGGLSRAARWAA